jgi:hypothetical protein
MTDVKGVWDPSGRLPCPDCGHKEYLLGFNYFNDDGEVMHSHYVCRYWESGKTGAEGRCGWHGWSVPGWDKEEPEQCKSLYMTDVNGIVQCWKDSEHQDEHRDAEVWYYHWDDIDEYWTLA